MRNAIVRAAYAAHQRRNGPQLRRRTGPDGPINHCLSIGLAGVAGSSELLIKFRVEQHDLAGNFVVPKSSQFIKIVYHYHFRLIPWAGVATLPPKAVSKTFCVVSGAMPGKSTNAAVSSPRTQWGTTTFSSRHIKTELAQFSGDVLRRKAGLGRTARAGGQCCSSGERAGPRHSRSSAPTPETV